MSNKYSSDWHSTDTFDGFNVGLVLRQLTDLKFKIIQSWPAVRKKAVLYPSAEVHSWPSQTSQMERFARIVALFKLTLLVSSKIPS